MKFNKQKVMKVLPFVILGYAFNKVVKSQVKHTTIRQKVYKNYSPQNVQVNE